MKKYLTSIMIVFLIVLLVVGGLSYFVYYKVVESYIDGKVTDILDDINNDVSVMIESQIDFNHTLVKNFLINNEDATLEELNVAGEQLSFVNVNNVKFGKITSTGLETENKIYEYKQEIDRNHYIHNYEKYYIISFANIYKEADQDIEKKIFLRINDTVAYFDAEDFFSEIFANNYTLENKSYLITADGIICYATEDIGKNYFFLDYLRDFNSNETINQLITDLKTKKTAVIQNINVLNEKTYLSYGALAINDLSDDYFLIQTYNYKDISDLNKEIMIPLLMMLIGYYLVFTVGLFAAFIIISRRNADIQVSKMELYFNKPYIMKVRKNGRIVKINRSFKKLNINWKGYRSVYSCTTPDENVDILNAINRSRSLTLQFIDRQENQLTFFMVCVQAGFSRYVIGENISTTYKEYTELAYQATFDKFTGLPNLEQLMSDLKLHLATIQKLYSQNMVINSSLVMFNIEQLYSFTNIFGNVVANRLVIIFAEMFKKNRPYEEMNLYRLSDNVFAMLFKNVIKYDDVLNWITESLEILKKPIEIDENQLIIKTQYGVFNIELDKYENLTDSLLYENAEIALAHAQSLRSVNYVVYNISLGRLIKREQLMEEDLKKAIENEEFDVYIQPQFDVVTNRIIGFEALTRWDNEKYKNDSPIHFIELAEKNNLIIPIGKIIIERSFAIAKKLEFYDIIISVNVSPAQLLQTGFVNQFIEAAEKYKINPKNIAIEVTETFLVQNFSVLIDKLGLLRKKGFKIHLDDFGTGYSSMLYLKDLPIDAIKIDKEFIKYINTDKYSRAIVSKIISLAKTLELEIIAEGVENDKQSAFLSKNGCNVIQGYLISKPIICDEALKMLQKYNVKSKSGTKKGSKDLDLDEGGSDNDFS